MRYRNRLECLARRQGFFSKPAGDEGMGFREKPPAPRQRVFLPSLGASSKLLMLYSR